MPTEPGGGPGILVALDLLVVDDPNDPRPLDRAATALDRLRWIGRPIVLAGRELVGRRLPETAGGRVAWVRATFGQDDLDVHPFDEPEVERVGEPAQRQAVELWTGIREKWLAAWLVTSHAASVGPARRAGLTVVRIGPRPSDSAATVERADYEARDLVDAVSRLLTLDTFSASRG